MNEEFKPLPNFPKFKSQDDEIAESLAMDISLVRAKIIEILDLKESILNITKWGDVVSEDRILIEKKEEMIEKETRFVTDYINNRFQNLIDEISEKNTIKSDTRTYSSKDIIQAMISIKTTAQEGLVPSDEQINAVTRAENIRPRFKEIIDLIVLLHRA